MTTGLVSLDGDVVVITGAGRGIGRAHALLFAARGAHVVVNDSGANLDGVPGRSPADSVVSEIRDSGGTAVASSHSIDDPRQAADLVKLAREEFGSVHVVVHNAGILRDKTLHNLSDDDIERVLKVHLLGAFNVLRPAVAIMREQRYGRVVLTSSASGLLGAFGQSNYGAAKMGLVGLMNVLAIEGAERGILVNTIAPSAKTRMTEQLLGPLASSLDPEHVSPLVVYLASRACTVTHHIFAVGGGRYARMFVGVTPGWARGAGAVATPEEIVANLGTILDTDRYSIPNSGDGELNLLQSAVKQIGPGPVKFDA